MKKCLLPFTVFLIAGCSAEMPLEQSVPVETIRPIVQAQQPLQKNQSATQSEAPTPSQVEAATQAANVSPDALEEAIPEPTLPPKLANIRVVPGGSSETETPDPSAVVETPDMPTTDVASDETQVHIADNYNIHTLLVGLNSAADLPAAKALASEHQLIVERFIDGINTLVLKTSGQNVPELIQTLAQESLFAFVETDHIATQGPEKETALTQSFRIFNAPPVNDELYGDQYGLELMNIPAAWDLAQGENIVVSVIDTGVDVDHDDLKNKLVNGYDAFSQVSGPEAADTSSLNYIDSSYKHGTHVAGVIAAETNNGEGIAGVAPAAKIMPVKIFPDIPDLISSILAPEENAHQTIISVLADAIVWSADNGAHIINLSLGVFEESEALERAVDYALEKNIVVVVAAGNQRQIGNQTNYLAALDGVIGVGATDANNLVTEFSNEGDYVSISAPGDEVVSSVPSLLSLRPYVKLSGTSMAAPHVAGVIALLKSKYGDLATPSWVKSRLETTALDRGEPGYDPRYGHGIVDAFQALSDASES